MQPAVSVSRQRAGVRRQGSGAVLPRRQRVWSGSGDTPSRRNAVDHKPGGVIAIADPIKATTPAASDALRRYGIRIVILTGDNKTTAEAVARKPGIAEAEATFCRRTRTALSKNSLPTGALSPWRVMA